MSPCQDTPSEDYQIVYHLHRWERTLLSLSLKDRLFALVLGKLNLSDTGPHNSVGWLPVFERRKDAETYQTVMAPQAIIRPVRRTLNEF